MADEITFPKKIVRNGSSDVVTIPAEVKEVLNLSHGEIVEVTIRKVSQGEEFKKKGSAAQEHGPVASFGRGVFWHDVIGEI